MSRLRESLGTSPLKCLPIVIVWERVVLKRALFSTTHTADIVRVMMTSVQVVKTSIAKYSNIQN